MNQTLTAPLDVKLMNMTASALFIAFVLLVVGALASWVSRQPMFAIGGVSVRGDVAHNNVVTLRANVASRFSGTFFTLDLAQARRAFEAVPWVRKAVVQREFPNRLRVALQEHQPVAYWGTESEPKLLNSYGEVFEANLGELDQESLPRLNGPEHQAQQVLQMYLTLEPLMEPLDLTVDVLELTGQGGWRAQLDNGAQVELGRGTFEEVVSRAHRFFGTLPQVTSKYGRTASALETADLRYAEGYALRLKGVSTVIPEVKKSER
jgi:cell division protein FtsQ